MNLIRNKKKQIEPLDNKALFKHCAGGSVSVVEKVFNEEVKPLLFIHGITAVYITGKSK